MACCTSPLTCKHIKSIETSTTGAMSGAVSTVGRSKRIFLLTHPRTASNLLVRILNLEHQPALRAPDSETRPGEKYEYFFVSTLPLRITLADRPSGDWSQDEHAQMKQYLQASADELRTRVESAEAQGNSVFVKEHLMWMLPPEAEDLVKGGANRDSSFWKVQFPQQEPVGGVIKLHDKEDGESLGVRNETVLSDSFLRTWTPTFLIRHPALVFPSLYRTSVDLEGREGTKKNSKGMFRLEMTFRWSRSLWEWYNKEWERGKTASPPIILDADDIILHPRVVTKYCDLVGLDAEKCRFEWERASAEEEGNLNFIEKRMKSSLLSSTGIIQQGKVASGLDIEQEAHKWSEEFGGEEAKKIADWVAIATADYEFLKERKLAVETVAAV